MGKKNNVSIKNKNIDKITNQVGVAKNCNIGENIYNNILYVISYVIVGLEIVLKAIRNIFRGKIFDENFLSFD